MVSAREIVSFIKVLTNIYRLHPRKVEPCNAASFLLGPNTLPSCFLYYTCLTCLIIQILHDILTTSLKIQNGS